MSYWKSHAHMWWRYYFSGPRILFFFFFAVYIWLQDIYKVKDTFIWYWNSETSLVSSLQFTPEDEWLSSFYSCLIKKVHNNIWCKTCKNCCIFYYALSSFNHFSVFSCPCTIQFQYDKENVVEAKFKELEREIGNTNTPSELSFTCSLKNNTDLLACKAEYYHQCGEYEKCFRVTSE